MNFSKKYIKKTIIIILNLIVSFSLFSQKRNCGTMEYLQKEIEKNPLLEQKMIQMEKQTRNWIKENSGLSLVSKTSLI